MAWLRLPLRSGADLDLTNLLQPLPNGAGNLPTTEDELILGFTYITNLSD
jgi:hypothetical protein